ncbi:MAG: hypothetical protein IJR43_00140 [Synergistaceae bacterium]|nr:hypothetical protein [Synergistaceae bacterium]
MKKVFALFMVSALLAFAGSAFAADPVITASPSSVTILPGASATVALSATNPNGGTLGAFSVTGGTASAWASVSGSALTITAPATATQGGSYTVTVSVTETYTESDTAGHASSRTATGTATINVTVGFLPPLPVISPRTASVTVAPGLTVTRTVSAVSSQGGTLTYEIVSGPEWATLSGTTITFAPPAGVTGSFTLVVRVTETARDGQTGTDFATFNIGVGYLGTLVPRIAASPASVTATAGQPVATMVTLTGTATAGAENSTLAFSKVDGPTWAIMLPTGAVAVQPSATTEEGNYVLTVRVTERAPGWTTGMADIDIPINVQAPPFTTPGIALSLQQITMTRGAGSVTASVTGTAGQGGTLEYAISAPSWVTMAMNGNTGTLTLNPDATVEPKTYSATVTVTETAAGYRAGSAKAAITIVVVKPIPPTPAPTITASTYAVNMTAGDAAQTVTVTGTASQGGTLAYEKVSGPAWATLSGTTLTVAPGVDVLAGAYPVVIRVTETTGAGTEDMLTGSAKTNDIVITVARNESSTVPEQTEEEKAQVQEIAGVETEAEETETEEHEEEVSYETTTEGTTFTLPEDVSANTDELADNATKDISEAMQNMGFSQEDAAQTQENVNNTLDNPATLAEFGSRLAISGSSSSNVRADKASLRVSTPTGNEMQKANKFLAGKAQDAGSGSTNLTSAGAFPKTNHPTGGYADFQHKFAEALYNTAIIFFRNPVGTTGATTGGNRLRNNGVMAAGRVIAAAEDNGNEAVFLNSNGDVVDLVPGNDDPSGALPGVVTIVTFLEPNVEYEPVIAVSVADLPQEVQEKVKEDTVEITVTTTATSKFTAQKNSFFTTMVDWNLISSTVYTNELQYFRISDDTGGRINHVVVGEDWTRTDTECNAMVANEGYDLTRVVRLPALDGTKEVEDHVYVVAVNFDITDANREKILASANNGEFVFYPDGPLGNTATARVMKAVEADGDIPAHFETLTVDEFKSSGVTTGYLAFWIPAGTELTRPMLTVKLEKTKVTPEPGPGPEPGPESDDFYITPSARYVTVALNNTEIVTYTAANATGDVTYSISPSADWVALTTVDNEATVTILPTDSALIASSPNVFTVTAVDAAGNTDSESLSITVTRQSSVPGSSGGGGCSAGFSAMALAVLGAFIARRKK